MRIVATSLLRDSYHHSSKLFSVLQFYSFNLFSLFNTSYYSLNICCCSLYICVIVFNILFHFTPLINLDQWYQRGLLFICFLCACPRQDLGTRSWDLNQSSLCKISHIDPNNNSWGTRRNMMEQETLLNCCSRNPLHDKGMKLWITLHRSFGDCI
jgi:hypothetical protein